MIRGRLTALGLARKRPAMELACWAVALGGALAWTMRDPKRTIEPQADAALAPADGRVLHVRHIRDEYWQAELLEIAIFLELWDVHVQRMPLDGMVVEKRVRTGAFYDAKTPHATAHNHQLATYLATNVGSCVVTQISGLFARRIVNWAAPGVSLRQGDRLGLIRFGSQVTVRLPVSASPLVGRGDRVRAGITPVARFHGEHINGPGCEATRLQGR